MTTPSDPESSISTSMTIAVSPPPSHCQESLVEMRLSLLSRSAEIRPTQQSYQNLYTLAEHLYHSPQALLSYWRMETLRTVLDFQSIRSTLIQSRLTMSIH